MDSHKRLLHAQKQPVTIVFMSKYLHGIKKTCFYFVLHDFCHKRLLSFGFGFGFGRKCSCNFGFGFGFGRKALMNFRRGFVFGRK